MSDYGPAEHLTDMEAENEQMKAEIKRLTNERDEAMNALFCTCNGWDSWTGVDQTPDGPYKVWRCDTCGRLINLSRSAASNRFIMPDAGLGEVSLPRMKAMSDPEKVVDYIPENIPAPRLHTGCRTTWDAVILGPATTVPAHYEDDCRPGCPLYGKTT